MSSASITAAEKGGMQTYFTLT